jgi:hypothetical protein
MEDLGPANGTIYGGQDVIGAAPSAIDCAVAYEWSVLVNRGQRVPRGVVDR